MLQPHPCWTHFEVLSEVHFMYTISRFKSWEVRSSMLQMVLDLELKQRNYSHLKTSAHTMNGNIAAAPHFTTVGHVFGALPGAQIMNTMPHFKSWEVRSP